MKRLGMCILTAAVAFAVAAPAGAKTPFYVNAKGLCPNAQEAELVLQCEPGLIAFAKATCGSKQVTFRVNCPNEVPRETLRAFLVLEGSITGGAFGVGSKPTTGGVQANLGMEFRLSELVGLEIEARLAVTGNLWDCQRVKASVLFGGNLLVTFRPSEMVRISVGVGGITAYDSSLTKIVDGVPFTLRLDVFFSQSYGLGFRAQGEAGPAWRVDGKVDVWWSLVGGLVMSGKILDKVEK